MISASLVKELREATGAGMLDCKKALEATNGSIDEAINWLREKGISKAAKKADRIAAEGLAATLIDGNNAVGLSPSDDSHQGAKQRSILRQFLTLFLPGRFKRVMQRGCLHIYWRLSPIFRFEWPFVCHQEERCCKGKPTIDPRTQ